LDAKNGERMVLMASRFVHALAQLIPVFALVVSELSTYQFAPRMLEAAQNRKMRLQQNLTRTVDLHNCAALRPLTAYFIMGGIIITSSFKAATVPELFSRQLKQYYQPKILSSIIRTILAALCQF
jgi:hypothetical protein